MKKNLFKVRAKVWLYPGKDAWYFITLPVSQGAQIKDMYGHLRRGWNSLRVRVTVGATSWTTSIFPDKESGSYLLPLKASIRKDENILQGDSLSLDIEIITGMS